MSLVDVQPYRCLFAARLRPLRGGQIAATAANIAMFNFVYVCSVWCKPKSEVA